MSASYSTAGYTESSVAYHEEKVVCIPAGTTRIFEAYAISETVYRDCNLLLYPGAKKIAKLNFCEENSPVKFCNRMIYTLKGEAEAVELNHAFYVAEIANYPITKFLGEKYDEYCGQKSEFARKYEVFEAADSFYNRYTKKGSWKH